MEQRLGPYRLLEELGRGGMGAVYRAQDTRSGREVALKVLLEVDSLLLERFRREAELVRGLTHPGLVQVLELSLAPPRPYAAFEFVRGETLKQRVERAGPLPAAEARALGVQLAGALEVAHAHGLLHRDVKPANVLLGPEGAKLADFGVVKDLDGSSLTATGAVLGTPSYLSPEQALGDKARLGPATDVYGLAATLYFALTGEPPFRGPTVIATLEQVISRAAPSPAALRPGLPPGLDAACRRGLAKEPEARFAGATELAAALSAEPLRPPSRRRSLVVLVALAAALALGAGWRALGPSPSSGPTPLGAAVREVRRAQEEGEPERVDALLEGLLARFPEAPEAYLELGLWRRQRGELELAVAAFGEGAARGETAELWARRAEASRALGDLESATRDTERALELDRDHALAWGVHGQLLTARGDHVAARAAYEAALERGLGMSSVYLELASACVALGDTDGVEAALRRGLVAHPRSAPLLAALGRTRYERGRRGEGHALLARAVELAPDDPRVAFERAEVAQREGRVDEALADLQRATAGMPGWSAPWLSRGRLLTARGDPAGAREAWLQALAAGAHGAWVYVELAEACEALGEHVDRAQALDRGLERHPRSTPLLTLRGRLRAETHDLRGAREDLDRALELDPHAVQARYERARLYRREGRLEEALASAQRAVELLPRFLQAWDLLAVLHEDLGRYPAALECAVQALRLGPSEATLWRRVGYLHYALKRFAEAEQALGRALALASDDALARELRGKARFWLGRYELASADLQAVLEQNPASEADVFRLLALSESSRGRLAEAAEVLERGLSVHPGDPRLWVLGAQLRLRQGEAEAALVAADRGVALDPQSAEAHLARGEALWTLERNAEAYPHFQQAERLGSQRGLAFIGQGLILRDEGRYAEALAVLDRGKRGTDSHLVRSLRGEVLRSLGRLAEALAELDALVQEQPEEPTWRFVRARHLAATGRLGPAFADCLYGLTRGGASPQERRRGIDLWLTLGRDLASPRAER